jgi:CubicO group peptidase (beta-lactamase class C family)
MNNIISSLTIIVLFFMFSSSIIGQTPHSQVQKANELLLAHQQESGSGISISVVKEDQIIYDQQIGYANLEHMIPVSDSSIFLVASIAKQFTTFSILLLEDQGLLSIDDDITEYLPELKDLPYSVSIRQLANHTSGFRNNTDINGMRGKRVDDLIDHQEMVTLLLRQKGLNFEPGSRFQYCNAGYVLLAEIIERVSGVSFAQFVEEHIFNPLGMDNSRFLDDPNLVIKNLAQSYQKKGDQYYHKPMNRTIVGSTGLYTTTKDLSLWASNYNQLKVGNKAMVQKMIAKSRLNSGELIPYGLGQESRIYKGLEVIFHGGGDAAYVAYLLRVPAHNFSVAITGNYSTFNPLDLAYGMIDIFLSEYVVSTPEVIPNYTQEELEPFAGCYQIFPGVYINILAENDTLFFQSYGYESKLPLPVIGENEFQFTPFPHCRFVFNEDQLAWYWSDFSYPGKKVTINPPDYADIDIKAYLGSYYSEELETSYRFIEKDGQIIATHTLNPDVLLVPIAEDAFINDSGYMSRVTFIRDDQGQIIACKLSGQDAYDVYFERQ